MLKLKEFRINKQIDQKKLGEILNIGNGTISNWEVGRTEPSIDYLIKIADFFQCSVDELLGREDYITGNIIVQGIDLSSEEQQLIELYKTLTIRDKAELLGFAKGLARTKK